MDKTTVGANSCSTGELALQLFAMACVRLHEDAHGCCLLTSHLLHLLVKDRLKNRACHRNFAADTDSQSRQNRELAHLSTSSVVLESAQDHGATAMIFASRSDLLTNQHFTILKEPFLDFLGNGVFFRLGVGSSTPTSTISTSSSLTICTSSSVAGVSVEDEAGSASPIDSWMCFGVSTTGCPLFHQTGTSSGA
eukprot:6274903-Amphidinium_carterae.2